MTEAWESRPPSKQTIEFMTDIKATMQLLQKDVENINRMLIRMDEENKTAHRELTQKIEKMDADHVAKLDKIENDNDCYYVNKEEFKPIKAFVYGLASFTLLSVLGAIIALVINK